MSRDLGRDVPDLEKLYARKLWADFSYPIIRDILGDLRATFFVWAQPEGFLLPRVEVATGALQSF